MTTSNVWFVYVIRCSDSTLYTGITNNIERRLFAHNSKKGAKYTMSRTPCILVSSFEAGSKSNALKLEYAFKRLSREKKLLVLSEGFSTFATSYFQNN
jgi:putative endonuclease